MKINVRTESNLVEGGDPYDPEDQWTSHTPKIYESCVTGVQQVSDYHDFEVPDGTEEVFVVWVIFSDGDTFQSVEGMIQVVEVFAEEDDAEKFQKAIWDFSDSNAISTTGILENYHIRGTGYFGSIQDVNYGRFRIRA